MKSIILSFIMLSIVKLTATIKSIILSVMLIVTIDSFVLSVAMKSIILIFITTNLHSAPPVQHAVHEDGSLQFYKCSYNRKILYSIVP